jgi:hypothetical protein
MRLPIIQGLIDRRMLVNYRVQPEALRAILPAPFMPKLIDGWAMAGICLIRLKHIRPRGLPQVLGLESENAAHRIAVEWDSGDGKHEGVYVVRRDSSSRLNQLAGGRLFPGVHHHATFDVAETDRAISLAMRSDDGQTNIEVRAAIDGTFPADSIFGSIDRASDFFAAGSIGYSPARDGTLDGMELRTERWKVEPLRVASVRSSFFEDRARFPEGTAQFDCALLMRGIQHEWHQCESMGRSVESAAAE